MHITRQESMSACFQGYSLRAQRASWVDNMGSSHELILLWQHCIHVQKQKKTCWWRLKEVRTHSSVKQAEWQVVLQVVHA
jgi:hypothetical protein